MQRRLSIFLLSATLLTGLAPAQKQRQQQLRHHYSFLGDRPIANLGEAVAAGMDLDGDGVPDILAGAPKDSPLLYSHGLVRAYSGKTGRILWSLRGRIGDRFGASVVFLGDITGDKIPDFAVGAWGGERTSAQDQEGYVEFWQGSGTVPKALGRVWGGTAKDKFGEFACAVPDVDNDGVTDLLVGANQNPGGPGYARLISSRTRTVLRQFAPSFPLKGGLFGSSLAAGDLTGDGIAEVLIGAPGETHATQPRAGHVYVFDARTGKQLASFGGGGGEGLGGGGIAVIHDFSRNGRPDFVVGMPKIGAAPGAGGLRVYQLGQSAAIATLLNGTANEAWGYSIAKVGDLDNDKIADLLVGSDASRNSTGSVRLVSCRSFRLMTSEPVFVGDELGDAFGRAVASAGDLDGDQRADFVIGARWHDGGGLDAGQVRVLSSRSYWFSSDTNVADIRRGGQQILRVDPGPSYANHLYLVLGSLRGAVRTNGTTLPLLVPDPYFDVTLQLVNSPLLFDSLRFTDPKSGARNAIWTAIPAARVLAGQTMWHCAVLFTSSGLRYSRAVPLLLR